MRSKILTLALLASACADNPYPLDLQFGAAASTRSHVAFVGGSPPEAVFVEPGVDALAVSRQPLPDAKSIGLWSTATLDRQSLLVMTAPASPKDEDVTHRLLRYTADGADVVEYEVAAPFTEVALSPDLRRAVLYFREASALEHLQNANQVAIVDFATNDVRDMTLDGFGGRLTGVTFPTQTEIGRPGLVEIDGVLRDLAVFLVSGEVIIVDLDDPTASQVAVQFGDLPFVPAETLLRPGDALFERPTLFVRSSEGSDVAMLTLVGKPDGIGFTVQVSLVPVGGAATDVVNFTGTEVPYLVSVSNGALVFTDIRTHQSFNVDMGVAQRVFLRPAEGDFGPVTQAVTWAPGGTELHTLELDAIEDTLSRRPRQLKVETGVNELIQLDDDRVLIGSGEVLYVVDLAQEQVTPLTSQAIFDPASSALEGNTLLLGTPGQEWVSTVDLLTLNPESMLLDEPIESFHYLPELQRIVLTHADDDGLATVVDATAPTRATSYTTWGFLAQDVLERNR